MGKFLKNNIEPRERKSSKTFQAPSKEKATTGRFMDAGDNYGVGFRNPVGKEQASHIEDGPIPFGCYRVNPDEL